MKKILLIEDEKHIAEGIHLNLNLNGYAVEWASDGKKGVRKWREWRPDLIILDIMMPELDGYQVLEIIRNEDEKSPILILSAKDETVDKVKSFKAGVDDYLSKPFALDELLARVGRLLERSAGGHRKGESVEVIKRFDFAGSIIFFEDFRALTPRGEIQLTEQELKLLRLFIANRGIVLSREKILHEGWGYSEQANSRTVDNFVARLRKYFEEDPKKPCFFKSIRSRGYLFDFHPSDPL